MICKKVEVYFHFKMGVEMSTNYLIINMDIRDGFGLI